MYKDIIQKLELLSNPTQKNIEGMARFGIRPKTKLLCIPIPKLRLLAKEIKKNTKKTHSLALKLWDSKMHEARILAGMIDNPKEVTSAQMEKWVKGFDTWDVCDQVCMNLFDKTDLAVKKIFEWSSRKEEFVKRTSFSLIAALAFHSKELSDKDFVKFFPLIKKASIDERNFVKKAVNWALRQIGKRNVKLNKEAITLAKEIQKINSKSAKWVANGALLELTNEKIQSRLKLKRRA